MPEIVNLPHRGRDRALTFKDAQLDEAHDDLADLSDGQAVVVSKTDVDGKPFANDSAARNYARAFANAYQERFANEAEMDDDDIPRRLLSTHAIPVQNAQGKATGKFIAAVSNNTRETRMRTNYDGPSRNDLMQEVREWRKAHPRDRSFRNYTRWDYDTLRDRVNTVTGYNDGIHVPPVDAPENGANAPENGNGETGADAQPENSDDMENVGA